MALDNPRRFQDEESLDRVRRLLGWTGPETRDGIRAGFSPLGVLRPGEFVLFISYILCGLGLPISTFFLLLLEDYGLQIQHLTPHSILQAAIFVHLCEMFVGVRPCVALFRHYFVLKSTGKGNSEVGAYYFQLRTGMAASYLPGVSPGKWDNWRTEWVLATTDAHDRLVLPTAPPATGKKHWKAGPFAGQGLSEEFRPVTEKISELAGGGLTSLHVFLDFTTRRLAPLRQRSRLACYYTGVNDGSRSVRGEESVPTQDELEICLRVATGEAFGPEQVVLPAGITCLCEDQGLRTAVLRSMPTLDDSGLAPRQTGGDSNRGINIPGATAGEPRPGPGPAGVDPRARGKQRMTPDAGAGSSAEPSAKRQRTEGTSSSHEAQEEVRQGRQEQRAPPPPPGQQMPPPRSPPPRQQQRPSGFQGRWTARVPR
jgi:hypothetical protein